MFKYILQRLLQGLLVMLALYTIVFFLVGWMPGDPFSSNEKNISPEVRENMKKAWGLDQPLWKQYLIYPKNLITEGSLGVSTEKKSSGLGYYYSIVSSIFNIRNFCIIHCCRYWSPHRNTLGDKKIPHMTMEVWQSP